MSCTECLASKGVGRTQFVFSQKSFPRGEVEGIQLQFAGFRIRQGDAHSVALHHPAHTRRNFAKHIAELQIRDNAVVKVEEQLEPILLIPQFQVEAQQFFVGLGKFVGSFRHPQFQVVAGFCEQSFCSTS